MKRATLRAVAVVPAGGASRRFGARAKLLCSLRGEPVLLHTLRQLSRVPAVREIVVVARARDLTAVRRLVERHRVRKVRAVVRGGATRMASVRRGLAAANPRLPYVVIHDAARPLVTVSLVRRTLIAARRVGAAIAAVPAADTMKQHNRRMRTLRTLPRGELWAAQTPQAFRAPLIQLAYRRAARTGRPVTDDAAAVEQLGQRVALIPGDVNNVKITWPRDLVIARALLNGHC